MAEFLNVWVGNIANKLLRAGWTLQFFDFCLALASSSFFDFKAENSSVAWARIASTGRTLFYSFQEVATKRNDLLRIPRLCCKIQKKTPRLIHVLKWHILPFPHSFSGTGKQVSKQTALWQTLKRKHLEFVQKLITPNTGRAGEKPWFSQVAQMPAAGSGPWLSEATGMKCICTSPGNAFLLKQNTAAHNWQRVQQTL